MAIQVQLRRDLSSNWTSNNPILAQGEPGLETDTNLIKLGDGVTNWNGLPYFSNLTGLVSLTANWENTYTTMQANSAIWSYVAANSANTDNSFGNSAYTTVNVNSAGWESAETTVATNSADWSYVAANSANTDNSFGNSAYTTVNVNSAGWESAETTVATNSADWSYVAANSANTDNSFGNSAYTTVNVNSAGWESAETTVATNSADWSYVAANSGSGGGGSDVSSLSSNWENTYTTVQTNSADWSYVAANSGSGGGGSDVSSLSSNWENTYTTVQTNSADWSYVAANSGFSYTDFYVTGDIYATGSLSADSIKFNTEAGITPGVGELTWNADEESLDYGVNSDVTLQIGQEQLIHVKADEDIKNGQAVYASGASGTGSGNITVRLYRAGAGDIEELYFIGVATQDIATSEFGFVSTFGKVRGVEVADTRASDDPQALSANNEGWDIGTILYVSPAEAGKYTQTRPVAPDKDIPVVMIISENGNQRTFFTRYEHGYHLSEIHDVLYNEPLSDGDLLTWNGSISAWENQPETDPVFSSWAQSVSSNYDSTYTTVGTNSASWDYQGNDLKALTANYDSTYTTVNVNSASWGLDSQTILFNEGTGELSISNGNTVSLSALSGGGGTLVNETDPIFTTWAQSVSSNYDSTYTTVGTNSASWDYQGNDLKALTANYDSTYTTVNVNSASWGLDSQTILFNEGTGELSISNGNTVSLSALSGGGGTLVNETDPIFTTWAQSVSSNYDSTYTTVGTNSASWDYQGNDLKALTANYDSTYTTVNVNSASWGLDSQTILFNEGTGELSISNGNTVSLSALSGGGGTLVNETDPIFTTWAQTYSANYESTYTTVGANSGKYESVYTTVQSNSSTWGGSTPGEGTSVEPDDANLIIGLSIFL